MAPPPMSSRRWSTVPARERVRRRYLPNVLLTDHRGRTVRFYDDLVRDKIVTINFMYARCIGVCVPTTANLLKVQQLLGARVGRDIFMYSITLRPQVDTVAVLAAQAGVHQPQRGRGHRRGQPRGHDPVRQRAAAALVGVHGDRPPRGHRALGAVSGAGPGYSTTMK